MRLRLFNTYEPVTSLYRDLIADWTARGWEVDVVVSRAEYRAGRDRAWILPGTRVVWTPSLGLNAGSRMAKLAIMVLYALSATIFSLLGPRVDRNVFLTQPPLFFVWGAVLQRWRRQPYVVVLMDLYPEVAIADGLLAADSQLTRMLLRLSHVGLRRADGVIAIGRCMVDRLVQLGVARERIHLIPNWAAEDAIRPVPHEENAFRKQQGWSDKFVILYSGNMGASHVFDDLLTVCARLRQRTNLLFAFIGQGSRLSQVKAAIEADELDSVALLPFQPLDKLAESLSAGDVHFVSLRDGFEGLVVPSKSYGILAAGRPLIYQGNDEGEIARLIAEEEIGIVVPLSAPDALEQAILAYLEDPPRRRREGARARALTETRCSKRAALESYARVLLQEGCSE